MPGTMKKLFTIIALLVAFSATAQKTRLEVNILTEGSNVERLSIYPMEFNNDAKSVPMRLKNDKYTATCI